MAERVQEFNIHGNQIKQWRDPWLEGAMLLFGAEPRVQDQSPAVYVEMVHAKIGHLTLENVFLSGACTDAGVLGSAKR